MPTEYFAPCSYAECGKVAPDNGLCVQFREQPVIIAAVCILPINGKDTSYVKLSVLMPGENAPHERGLATETLMKQWDDAKRFG